MGASSDLGQPFRRRQKLLFIPRRLNDSWIEISVFLLDVGIVTEGRESHTPLCQDFGVITVDILPSVFIYDKTLPQKLTSTMMTQKVFYLRTAPSLGDSPLAAELGHVANQTRCYLDSRFPERIRQWCVKYYIS